MKAMQHHFDVELATKYGIVEAILINNFQFWLARNVANQTHFHDGRYWTYNSVNSFAKLFPYLTADKIRRALERLVEYGVLIKGNYNENPTDRTSWYSLNDDYMPIWQQCQSDLAATPNGFGTDAECNNTYNNSTDNIPYNVEDNSSRIINNTSNNISSSKEKKKKGLDLSFISIEYSPIIERWLKYKSEKHQGYTQTGIESLYRRLLKLSNGDARVADQIVEYSMAQLYSGIFVPNELKQISQHGSNNQTSGNMFSAAADELRRQRTTF